MMIDYSDGEFTISDLGSLNGIKVSGIQLPQGSTRTLYLGDTLILGDTEVVVTKLVK
jgi:hypothetical protein